MPLLHSLRLGLNRLIGPLGLALDKVPKTRWGTNSAVVMARVGRFSIEVPSLNPISTHYDFHPDYSSQLGRLVSIVRKKYKQLAAIDVGANVGDTACIIKSVEDIPLLCIEGDKFTFSFLEKNLKQFQNASPHNLFVGEKTGPMAARVEKAGWNTTILPDQSNTNTLHITSLDDFLASQTSLETFKLLKVDAEGFDCAIVRGARGFIDRVHPVVSFEYNRQNMEVIGEKGIGTLAMLKELGYDKIIFHNAMGKLLCVASLSEFDLIQDLHDYIGLADNGVIYYDVTLFHANDDDIADVFAQGERLRNRAA